MGRAYRGEYHSAGSIELEFEQLSASTDGAIALNAFPVGAGCLWFTDTAPAANWILAQGQALRQVEDPRLYATWGITFGAGNDSGATQFSAPDLRQRFPMGKAASGTGATLAGTGGTIDHTHSVPLHGHTASSNSTGAHTHDVTVTADDLQFGSGENAGHPATYTSTSNGDHQHTITVADAAASTSGSGNPPYLVVNFAIRAW